MTSKTLIITGGHHTSALVIAKLLSQQGWHIIWFGNKHSHPAEYQEVTTAGFRFYDLKAGKFYQLLHIPWGFVQAAWWLLKLRPRGIVSFGGYLAVPTVLVGWLLGIPSITHEQTTVAGWANLVISRFVQKICLAFPDTQNYYPSSKTLVTGLPLPPEIIALKDSPPIKGTIFVTGGKQGSHIINQVVFSVLPELLKKYHLIHQTGTSAHNNDFVQGQEIKSQLPPELALKYEIQPYFYGADFAAALGRSQAVISRAGAHNIYYLGFLGKPSLLIPLPHTSHDEQEKNAQFLALAGLAIVLPQDKLTPDQLLTMINQALKLSPRPLLLPDDASQRLVAIVSATFT